MENGIEYITCDRAGCNCVIGAKRYEDNKVVEEEYVPSYIHNEDGSFCDTDCATNKDDFIGPDEWADGPLEDALSI